MKFASVAEQAEPIVSDIDVSRIVNRKSIIRNIGRNDIQQANVGVSSQRRKLKGDVAEISLSKSLSAYEGISDVISFSVIKKMNRDPVIAFCYAVLSSIIRSLQYNFRSEDKLQQKIVEDMLDRHYDIIVENLCTAIYNGFSISQKLWVKKFVRYVETKFVDGGGNSKTILFEGFVDYIDTIKNIDPSITSLKYIVDRHTEEIKYVQQEVADNKERAITIFRKQLIHFATGSSFDRTFGRSRYINAYIPFEIGMILNKFLLKAMDDSAASPIEVRYPTGTTYDSVANKAVDNFSKASELLDSLIKTNAYAIPSDTFKDSNVKQWEVNLKTDWQDKISSKIVESIKTQDYKKAIALFVPPALCPVEGNDGGDMQAGLEQIMFIEEPFVGEIERVIKRDFIDQILAMNFNEETVAPYSFSIDRSMFNKRQIIKELVSLMVRTNGTLLASGKTFTPKLMPDMESIFRQLGIPFKQTFDTYDKLTGDTDSSDDITSDTKDGSGDLLKEDQRNKDSNGKDRLTPRESRAGKKKPNIPGAA